MTSATTQRIYEALPPTHRDADEDLGWPLLRYLSLVGDQAGEIETLLDRFQAGELTDPDAADTGWLRWLGSLIGASIPAGVTGTALRDAIRYAPTGWRAGTRGAVADAAKSALTGTRFVQVYDHSVSSPGDGTQWDVLLVTRISETPDVPAVLAAVVTQEAKPAGVVLHHRAYTATWAAVDAAYPTWADRNGLTWAQLEETGL